MKANDVVQFTADSPIAVCRKLREYLAAQGQSKNSSLSGTAFFGLSERVVIELLEELPGATGCVNYTRNIEEPPSRKPKQQTSATDTATFSHASPPNGALAEPTTIITLRAAVTARAAMPKSTVTRVLCGLLPIDEAVPVPQFPVPRVRKRRGRPAKLKLDAPVQLLSNLFGCFFFLFVGVVLCAAVPVLSSLFAEHLFASCSSFLFSFVFFFFFALDRLAVVFCFIV